MFNLRKKFKGLSRLQFTGILALLIATLIVACDVVPSTVSPSRQELHVWWSEGYYPEETNAIRNLMNEWSEQSGIEVKLKFFSEADLHRQTKNSLGSNDVADLIYGYNINFDIVARAAWKGQLVDTSDLIEPIQDKFIQNALRSVIYRNDADDKESFYAVPIAQSSIYIHYWRHLLEQVGLSDEDIPKQWNSFWQFWANNQDRLRDKGIDIYGLGLPMSTTTSDTFLLIEQILEAYNIYILDENGRLNLDNTETVKKLAEIFSKFVKFYKDDYIPENSINWTNADNNVEFLSRNVLMTANPTLSIPGSQYGNSEVYEQKMATMEWPNQPNGQPMPYITSVKQMILPKQAPKTEQAKELVQYMMQPERIAKFNEGSRGRFYPVMSDILKRPFWNDISDPHIPKLHQYFQRTRPSYVTLNPAYADVYKERVWAQALSSIIQDNVSPRQAAENAVEKINQIFEEWE